MFVVVNGPAEQPTCPNVQNDVFLRLIGLHKIRQVSLILQNTTANEILLSECMQKTRCCQNTDILQYVSTQ